MNEQLQSPDRPVTRTRLRAVRNALGLVLVLVAPGGGAQNPLAEPQQPVAVQYSPRAPGSGPQFEDEDPVLLAKRLRALNIDRQKRMISDAAMLLKLATELNAEVMSDKPDSLIPAELHQVAEIEKLAHSVKEKMRYTQGDTPAPREPVSPWFR